MACTPCSTSTDCGRDPCTSPAPVSADNESLSSALDNFILNFYGTVTKTVVDGAVVWTLPCDLAEGIPGYPRDPAIGTACYFRDLFIDFDARITSNSFAISSMQGTIDGLGTLSTQDADSVLITGGSITGLPVPTNDTDAATKQYVDSIGAGLTPRVQVSAATTANISLAPAPASVDGVTLTLNMRVLVKNQSAPAENGVYVFGGVNLTRATDSDTAAELSLGYYYFVQGGTVNQYTGWFVSTAPTVLNTDPVAFSQFSSAFVYVAGDGVSLTGATFAVNSTVVRTSGVQAIAGAKSFSGLVSTTAGLTAGSTGYVQFANSGLPSAGPGVDIVYLAGTGYISAFDRSLSQYKVLQLNASQINFGIGAGPVQQYIDLNGFQGAIGQTVQKAGSFTTLSASGLFSQGGTDGVGSAFFVGATKAVRYSFNSTAAIIEATDQTGAISYQPLYIGGSSLNFYISGTLAGLVTSTGINATPIGQTTPAAAKFTVTDWSSNANKITTKGNLNLRVINVRDYGATGDGTTDDAAAIILARAAMTDYSALYFPPGRYRITGGINSFASLSHILVYGEGATILNDSGASGSNTFVFEHTCDDVEIRNLRFVGTATVRGSGIHIRLYCGNARVVGNYFERCSDFALHVSNDTGDTTTSDNIIVEGNSFFNTLGDGVHVSSATNVVIANNTFYQTGDDSIGIVRDSLTASGIPTRIVVTGNTINRAGYGPAAVSGMGIRIAEANDVVVSGNVIDYTYQAPIVVERYLSTSAYNTRIKISGNKVLNGNQLVGQLGSIGASFCQGVTISDNKIDDAANGGGIAFLDCNDLVIQGNQIRNVPSRGIGSDDGTTTNVAANCYRVWILGNSILYTLANQAIYAVAPPGKTINDLVIAGNVAGAVPAGDYIYYDRVTNGKIVNNTQLASNTIGAGGTVSGITPANNN